MKKMKSIRDGRAYLADEELPEFWEEHDASEILEHGEKVELKIKKPEYHCASCGSSRIRKRMIDLPVLDGAIVLKRVKTLYCAECKTATIEKNNLNELKNKLNEVATGLDVKVLSHLIENGLIAYEKNLLGMANTRRVISIYFPTKGREPAKAQISLPVSDPLYPKLNSLTSEDVRNMLGLFYFEDLEREAKKQNRTISQYIKLELAKKILTNPLMFCPLENVGTTQKNAEVTFTIFPQKAESGQSQARSTLALAAKSEGKNQILLETNDKRFSGVLAYNYDTAELFIDVRKNELGFKVFDIDLFMDDSTISNLKDVKINHDRFLLLSPTKYTDENVSKVVLKTKC